MCFSLEASFVAGTVLSIIGVASISKVKKTSQLLFAALPFMFAIQQFTEGFVWLTLGGSEWHKTAVTLFLIFAQVIWPVYVPLSILLVEKNVNHRKALWILLAMGILLSLYVVFSLLVYNISAIETPYHIHYEIGFPPEYMMVLGIVYFFPIVLPPFASGRKRMWILGLLNFTSFLIARLFFEDYLISVWCFFAALISTVVFLIMKDLNKEDRRAQIYNKI
jgi:hypothetical protein